MSAFFLAVELFSYSFTVFLFLKKKEIAIVYLPVIIFANNIIVPVFPASAFYLSVSLLIFSFVFKNPSYYKHNISAFLLFIYFIALLPQSEDIVFIRPYVFGVLWLFTVIPTISAIYQKYPRNIVFKELTDSALIILILFTANVLVSTAKGFTPHEMYGITTGILYGNVYAAGFNIIALSIFATTLRFLTYKSLPRLLIMVVCLSFITLSLRRSVMVISLLGVVIAYLTLLTREKAKIFIMVGMLTFMIGFIIYSSTNLADSFKERYELRKLDERELEEEKRFIEYELLYKDMFVYHDYSPLTGYELFNSWGNYGRGALDDRSLHGDLTSITHSSGLIGLLLYLLMVFTAFRMSFKAAETRTDMLTILFCAFAFVVYTITGRYTEIGSTIMLYLLLMLPLAKDKEEEAEPTVTSEGEQPFNPVTERVKEPLPSYIS